MLNKAFRNNGFVVSVGNGMGTSLFPCPPAGMYLRRQTNASGVNWSGCGNYGYSDTSVADYDYYTDGNCGEYWTLAGTWNRPIGDILYQTDCCQVIWNGSTYYVDDNCNPCGDANTLTGQTRAVNVNEIYWEGCGVNGYFSVSYDIESEYHAGDCSTYWLLTGSFQADNGTEIYSRDGCCFVIYDSNYPSSYYVNDNCQPCPDAGPTGNTRTVDVQELHWSGCGTEGYFTYAYNIEAEYHDGLCTTYWTFDSSWSAMNGDTILDNGCCTVNYVDFAQYTVNDNCSEPPPPDYPPAGTILDSGSGDSTAQIEWGSEIGQSNYQDVTVGSYSFQTVADGMGGSTYESWGSFYPDGTGLFVEPIGIELNLNWVVDVNGSSVSDSIIWGQEVGNWTLESGTPSRTSTSLVDILTDGYMIYESDSWWNGDANVKVQVIFQSGGGYLTNTITF